MGDTSFGRETDKEAKNRAGLPSRMFAMLCALAAVCIACICMDGCRARSEPGEQIDKGRYERRARGNEGLKNGSPENGAVREPEKKLKVVTTLFPYYDFLRQIAGDRIELEMVVPAGMDSHSFEPTPADILTIQGADLLVCNGGAMEQWLDRVLASLGDDTPGRVVTMMDYVEVLEEEFVEGMEDSHSAHGGHIHAHDADEEEDGQKGGGFSGGDMHAGEEDGHLDHEEEYDEHIWTSPANAIRLTEVLEEILSEEDPEHADLYAGNAAAFTERLRALDQEFRAIVAESGRKLLVFGDKFPMRYFFDEYGLEYRAAFSGCSSDTEPSAKTIAYLIDRVREERIPAVYYLELSTPRVAEIIGEETGAVPLLFHSCHNVTRRQFDSGVTYLELMEQNALNLRKGLGSK